MSVANNHETRKNSKVISRDVYIKDLVKKSGCGETFVINFDSDIEVSNKKKKPLRLQQVRPKASETRLKSAFAGSSQQQSKWRPKKKHNHASQGGGQGGKNRDLEKF